MQDIDLAALQRQVLWGAFALSLALGVVVQRSHFCTMGALADVLSMRSWARLRMWALAAGTAMLGFNLMVGLGWLQAADTLYAAPRLPWLSQALGGLLFGWGMVLASGCGSRNLVRLGGGNLKALVVLLVMGLSAWAALKGLLALWRVASVDRVYLSLATGQDLPSLLGPALGLATPQAALVLGGLLGAALVAWALSRRAERDAALWLGGLGSGLLLCALWWLGGRWGLVAEHPETLERVFVGASQAQRMDGFSFVAPLAAGLEWLMYASDAHRRLHIGIVSVAGVLLGGWLAALAGRQFRWESFRDAADMRRHLLGAFLMGVGGVLGLGCSIGQGLSGLSTLALGSFITLAGIVTGALLQLRRDLA